MTYPDSKDIFRRVADLEKLLITDQNNMADTVEGVQDALGTNPEGGFADVKARLVDIETKLSEAGTMVGAQNFVVGADENSFVLYGQKSANEKDCGITVGVDGKVKGVYLWSSGNMTAGSKVKVTVMVGATPTAVFVEVTGAGSAVNVWDEVLTAYVFFRGRIGFKIEELNSVAPGTNFSCSVGFYPSI